MMKLTVVFVALMAHVAFCQWPPRDQPLPYYPSMYRRDICTIDTMPGTVLKRGETIRVPDQCLEISCPEPPATTYAR